MQVISPYIDKSRIIIQAEEIIRLLGGQEGSGDPHASALVEQYMEVCSQIMTPLATYVMAESVEAESPEEIAVAGLSFNSGKIVRNMLRHSGTYAFFLVTVGPEPEELARDLLAKGDFLDAYISDLIASALVDSVADAVHEEIRKAALAKDMKVTNRYSPGYCTWQVSEQQKLFSLFPENSCGISLSDSSLMSPVKSISGIIGLGSQVKFNEYTCEICPMKTCQFRKDKNHL